MNEPVKSTERWTRRPEGSNWGDFGPDDQVGRLNLITPERRLAALKEVREGKVFTLSLPLDFPGGEEAEAIRKPPKLFSSKLADNDLCNHPVTPGDICCDDGVVLYLQHSTQWDSLAHWGRLFDVDGSGSEVPVYYNGYRAGVDAICAASGGPKVLKLGIENMAMTGVQGRGVMVDLVRAYGTGRTHVGYDLLMRAMDQQGVEVREGDFLVLHTGYAEAVLSCNRRPDFAMLATAGAVLDGTDEALLKWVEDSGVAAICADNDAVEEVDPNLEAKSPYGLLPLHDRCLFRLGIHLGELWWLGDLARYLGETGRHAFLLTAPPLRLPGAAGSPATPVATV